MRRLWPAVLAFTLVSMATMLAATEAYLRWSGVTERVEPGDKPAAPGRHLALREYQPDSRYGFAPPEVRRLNGGGRVAESYRIETDSDGFIQPGRMHEAADLTVVFLGGSTTECMFVEPQSRFPYLAGRLLERRLGLKVDALNGAKSGNNVAHVNLLLMGKAAPLRPDWVVLMEAVNDLGVLASHGSYWNDSSEYALVRRPEAGVEAAAHALREAAIPATTRAYHRLKERLRRPSPGTGSEAGGAWTPEIWVRSYESALRQFVASARAWGMKPALMTQVQLERGEWRPAAGDVVPPELFDRYRLAHDLFNERLREVARDEGVLLIDLAAAGGWTSAEVYDGLHFTDAGSERVAALVADALAAAESDGDRTNAQPEAARSQLR